MVGLLIASPVFASLAKSVIIKFSFRLSHKISPFSLFSGCLVLKTTWLGLFYMCIPTGIALGYVYGELCQKKHTYICSNFEATGICPQGSTCKLHHPKNQSRGVKRKQQSREQQQQKKKNVRGCYFGSKRPAEVVVNEQVVASSGIQASKNDDHDIFCQEGKYTDYISLDFSDEDTDGI